MRVALGSGKSRLVGLSDEAFRSMDVARMVAFGSNVCGAINKPPSNVQNFWPSSGYVRLHLGQLFIHADLLNGSQIGHKYKRGKSNSALTYWFSSKLDPSTPKAFANVSPGLERSDNLGNIISICFQP